MREEYKAIIDAGLTVQLDDPSLAESWDQINPEPSLADYLEFIQLRVEATNWALRGLPQDKIRLHVCWGSWHGPHTTDIPFADIIDSVLQVNAGAYSFEAANVRHEHEWRVWEDTKLPEGKIIIPGVVIARHERGRAPGARGGPDRAFRGAGGARKRHCVHRLRTRRQRPSADRLRQAGGPRRGRSPRQQAALVAGGGRQPVPRAGQARVPGTPPAVTAAASGGPAFRRA